MGGFLPCSRARLKNHSSLSGEADIRERHTGCSSSVFHDAEKCINWRPGSMGFLLPQLSHVPSEELGRGGGGGREGDELERPGEQLTTKLPPRGIE